MAKKKKEPVVESKSILDWCNEQHAEGKELTLKWDGGGDSGWVYFEIDGVTVENKFTEALINHMYDELDYGSWAGEFSANGSATYDPIEQAFVGEDYYSEDSDVNWGCEVLIKVPKSLWFDQLELSIEGEDPNISCEFTIKNGFLTDTHETITEELSSNLEDQISGVITDFMNNTDHEFRSMWTDLVITRSEFAENEDYLEHTITNLSMGTFLTEDKYVCLNISSLTEPITESDEN